MMKKVDVTNWLRQNSNESGWALDCLQSLNEVPNRISGKRFGYIVGEKYLPSKGRNHISGFLKTGPQYYVYRFVLNCVSFEALSYLFRAVWLADAIHKL